MKRYLSPELPALQFEIKSLPEDFVVSERRAKPPSGTGEHLHLWVEKRGLTTERAVRLLGRALGRPASAFGFCGLKDRQAITRQWISVQGADPKRLEALHSTYLQVLETAFDRAKLRRGGHAGNRFSLVLRGLQEDQGPALEAGLEPIRRIGLPNFYGPQRYGVAHINVRLGAHLLRGEIREYLRLYLSPEHCLALPGGLPDDNSDAGSSEANGHSADLETELQALTKLHAILDSDDKSAWKRATGLLSTLPHRIEPLLRQMARRPLDWDSLWRSVPKADFRLHGNSLQSAWFDRWLQERMAQEGRWPNAIEGDCLAHPGQRDTTWAEGGEPAFGPAGIVMGPLFGPSMSISKLGAAALEQEILQAAGWEGTGWGTAGRGTADRGATGQEATGQDAESTSKRDGNLPKGARRPMLVPVDDLEVRWQDGQCLLDFCLPPGSFATSLVAQLRKDFPSLPPGAQGA